MDVVFEKETQSIMIPTIREGKLFKQSVQTGLLYEAGPEESMVSSNVVAEIEEGNKHKRKIKDIYDDPVNMRMEVEGGCSNCGRIVIAFRRIGASQRAIYVCKCGTYWYP